MGCYCKLTLEDGTLNKQKLRQLLVSVIANVRGTVVELHVM